MTRINCGCGFGKFAISVSCCTSMFTLVRSELMIRRAIVLVVLTSVTMNIWILYNTNPLVQNLDKDWDKQQVPKTQLHATTSTANGSEILRKKFESFLPNRTENKMIGDPIPSRQSTDHNGRHHLDLPILNIKVGFVIGVSFWDQQTFSTSNILSLMCWAGHIGAAVVQPYMIGSKFQVPLSEDLIAANETVTQLKDLYDIDFWNTACLKKGYAPLIAWQDFFQFAPKSVVLVYFKSVVKHSCELDLMKVEYSSILEAGGFTIKRQVCLKSNGTLLSPIAFHSKVYGNLLPNETTVIFQEWSATTISRIIDLRIIRCSPTSNTVNLAVVSPSQNAIKDSDNYIKQYVSGEGVYLAVLLRLEWIIHYKREFKEVLHHCINTTKQHLISTKIAKGLSSTFVGVDIGKYGSITEKNLNSDIVVAEVENLFGSIDATSPSLNHLEESFENVTHSNNSGYIGFLQKLIASKGTCLITLGGGSFQKHALRLYKLVHAGRQCYITLNSRCVVSAAEGLSV